MMTLPGTVASQ